jgi:hypothetical protein
MTSAAGQSVLPARSATLAHRPRRARFVIADAIPALRSIRHGQRPLAEVLDAITSAETRLTELRDSPALPDQPDRAWVDDWLHRSYLDFWAQRH